MKVCIYFRNYAHIHIHSTVIVVRLNNWTLDIFDTNYPPDHSSFKPYSLVLPSYPQTPILQIRAGVHYVHRLYRVCRVYFLNHIYILYRVSQLKKNNGPCVVLAISDYINL